MDLWLTGWAGEVVGSMYVVFTLWVVKDGADASTTTTVVLRTRIQVEAARV